MPLVDDNSIPINKLLTADFSRIFKLSHRGTIIDAEGNEWLMWNVDELNNWLRLFETNLGIPFGRKIHNCAADCEEIKLQTLGLKKRGFFKKNYNKNILLNRWRLLGWGVPHFTKNKIESNCMPSISAGFYLATKEYLEQKRFKIEWNQVSDKLVNVNLSHVGDELPMPNKLVDFPWSLNSKRAMVGENIPFELEEMADNLVVDGEIMSVLPVDLFARIIHTSAGYSSQTESSKFHSWICDGLTESQIFALTLTCQTSKEIFLRSDSHIFIQDLDSWKEIIQYRLKRFGFGDIISVSGEEHNTGFVIEKSHSSPIFIGMLVGMWERATGKASQCTISFEDNKISLQITTLLEYAP